MARGGRAWNGGVVEMGVRITLGMSGKGFDVDSCKWNCLKVKRIVLVGVPKCWGFSEV